MTTQPDNVSLPVFGPDGIRIRRWFAVYAALVLAAGFALGMLVDRDTLRFSSWAAFQESVRAAGPAIKLLIFGVYLSLCCTFVPLNTSWIVSAVAMQEVAVADGLVSTVLLVSAVGAAASMVANLNDYHLFTLLLRSDRVAKVRHARAYRAAAGWFNRSPFALLLIFNLLPIPVDVARMLAATHRYRRLPFAAANFIGRFFRYMVIAGLTYLLGRQGWIATVALLGLAVVLGLGKVVWHRIGSSSPETTHES